MKHRNKIVAAGGSFAAALLAVGLAVSPASAWWFAGTWQGQSLQGNWRYNWADSYAEAEAPYGKVVVWARQDGGTNTSEAAHVGDFKKATNHGYEWDTDDGAGAHIKK